jgi:hypothetical protein
MAPDGLGQIATDDNSELPTILSCITMRATVRAD